MKQIRREPESWQYRRNKQTDICKDGVYGLYTLSDTILIKETIGEQNLVILIAGASHTGKTALAQKLLKKYQYPYLSIDHLKMGLIRSGNTVLTPNSDEKELTDYLWPIVREIVKTVIENGQNLIVEGCYIPFDWEKELEEKYREKIKCVRLVMSENYIQTHFDDIKAFASVIEQRLDDSDCTLKSVLSDNINEPMMCKKYGVDYLYIDTEYDFESDL